MHPPGAPWNVIPLPPVPVAKEASLTDQFDAPWKVAVERFLQPLLQLCFPVVHDAIDWRHPPEFLDTELQGLDRQMARDLWRVIAVLTRLPQDLELRFRTELATLPTPEGAVAMTELITPYEEIVLEEGLAKGRVEGRITGLTEGLLRALEARFGTVPEAVRQQVTDVRDEARLCEAMRLVITEPTLERFLAKF